MHWDLNILSTRLLFMINNQVFINFHCIMRNSWFLWCHYFAMWNFLTDIYSYIYWRISVLLMIIYWLLFINFVVIKSWIFLNVIYGNKLGRLGFHKFSFSGSEFLLIENCCAAGLCFRRGSEIDQQLIGRTYMLHS